MALSIKHVVVVDDGRVCWRRLYDNRRVVAVYCMSINCNSLSPLLRFVVDLLYNLFLQLTRFCLTELLVCCPWRCESQSLFEDVYWRTGLHCICKQSRGELTPLSGWRLYSCWITDSYTLAALAPTSWGKKRNQFSFVCIFFNTGQKLVNFFTYIKESISHSFVNCEFTWHALRILRSNKIETINTSR